jgi:penicillinase repressor
VAAPKLSKLEFQIMETLWAKSETSLREIQESFPAKQRPAYTTIQTTVYRMEAKGIVRRVRKVGNFHGSREALAEIPSREGGNRCRIPCWEEIGCVRTRCLTSVRLCVCEKDRPS